MTFENDKRIVMTLDAGGTNFVFNAIQGNQQIIKPVKLPSNGDNLEKCLSNIIDGFKKVKSSLTKDPVAISFAFPGPADYPNGIIGDLGNLPAFRDGIALGPMLEDIFEIPVFINNDGDLFAYGEAIAGFLPWLNDHLAIEGSFKRYHNLLGITLGTGFGAGIVSKNELFLGDNSAGAEIWLMRNFRNPGCFAEEGASIRAVQHFFSEKQKEKTEEKLTPKDIYEIARSEKNGNREAAIYAFEEMGKVVGDALANAITLIDGIIVIGGGLTGAQEFFMPSLVNMLNSKIYSLKDEAVDRLEMKAFNLEDKSELEKFIKGNETEIKVPFSNRKVPYDPMKRIGVGIAKLDTSLAVSIGAYTYALKEL